MSQLFASGDQSIGVSTSTSQHDGIRALLKRGSSISLISYLCLSQSLCLSLPGKSIWSHSQDAGKTIWAHSKNEAVCMPGHRSSPGAKCTGTFTLDILVSTAVRNKCLSYPVWYSVTAAGAGKDTLFPLSLNFVYLLSLSLWLYSIVYVSCTLIEWERPCGYPYSYSNITGFYIKWPFLGSQCGMHMVQAAYNPLLTKLMKWTLVLILFAFSFSQHQGKEN